MEYLLIELKSFLLLHILQKKLDACKLKLKLKKKSKFGKRHKKQRTCPFKRGKCKRGGEREREINSNKVTLCELLSFSQKFREKFNRKKSEKLDVAGFGHFYTMKSQTTCV